ncbi:MAG TPA: hypothetical protein VGX03_34375 [Candidatus Binatia bacterium]|nr:hypothetical protein [Candidatus Binatia bacterium]
MAKVTIKFDETTPQQRQKVIRDLAKRVDINESLEELIATLRKFEDKYGMHSRVLRPFRCWEDGRLG